MDVYSYLFKKINKKTKVNFENLNFNIKFYSDENNIIYEIDKNLRITIDKLKYSSHVLIFKKEYQEEEFKKILKLVDIINRYNYINFSILEDNLVSFDIDYITVNTLSGFENPYLKFNYKVLQKNFPESNTIDILKSNSYYYDKFFKENIEIIINLKLKKFISFLKKIYGKSFTEKEYLKDIVELEKFDYILKDFILEKANLNQKKCFNFFYYIMGRVLNDLHLLPKKYIYFY